MKRLIAVLLILSLTLCGCGSGKTDSGSNGSFKSNEDGKSAVEETDVSEEGTAGGKEPEAALSEADIVGTYVGLHGSGITFLSNGTAEYFWKEWIDVETGDKWSFDGQKVTMHSNALEYDIYAEVAGENISTLNFQSDADTWMDEMFVRVSDDGASKDADTYIALIEKQLNTKLERPSNTFEVHAGGFVLEVPANFELMESEDKYLAYGYEDENVVLYIAFDAFDQKTLKAIKENEKKTESIMEEKLHELVAGLIGYDNEMLNNKITDNVKPAGSMGNTYHYSTGDEGAQLHLYETWAVNTSTGDVLCVFMLNVDTDQNEKNSEEYLEMIRTAVPEGQAQAKASSDSTSTTDKATGESKQTDSDTKKTEQKGGVDPELKAFLDSYEDFVDEYVEFMKKYQADPTNAVLMLSEYADIMQKYADFADKIDKYNSNNLSTEDYKYYIEVTSRCAQKMLDIY